MKCLRFVNLYTLLVILAFAGLMVFGDACLRCWAAFFGILTLLGK